MGTSYCIRDILIRSEMISNGIVTARPERAVMTVSTRLNNGKYRLNRGQGWEPQLLARLIGIFHWRNTYRN
eukprot:6202831-Pleurochrysis_carterae.AAC.1